MKKHTLTFAHEKDTKNAVRFQEEVEEGKPTVVGTLYVQKWATEGAKKLKITIEEAK